MNFVKKALAQTTNSNIFDGSYTSMKNGSVLLFQNELLFFLYLFWPNGSSQNSAALRQLD